MTLTTHAIGRLNINDFVAPKAELQYRKYFRDKQPLSTLLVQRLFYPF